MSGGEEHHKPGRFPCMAALLCYFTCTFQCSGCDCKEWWLPLGGVCMHAAFSALGTSLNVSCWLLSTLDPCSSVTRRERAGRSSCNWIVCLGFVEIGSKFWCDWHWPHGGIEARRPDAGPLSPCPLTQDVARSWPLAGRETWSPHLPPDSGLISAASTPGAAED